MRKRAVGLVLLTAILWAGAPPAAKEKPPAEQKAELLSMAQSTLKRLYKVQPKAKAAVEGAAGYAVFKNFGMKILVAGGGSGKGVVVDNKTKGQVFMKMAEIQAGLGFGVKKFKLVWVFETREALDRFVDSGWELGGQTTAAATTGDRGAAFQGAIAIAPGVWVYQLTDKGLALELTVKGTKYYRDKDLN